MLQKFTIECCSCGAVRRNDLHFDEHILFNSFISSRNDFSSSRGSGSSYKFNKKAPFFKTDLKQINVLYYFRNLEPVYLNNFRLLFHLA